MHIHIHLAHINATHVTIHTQIHSPKLTHKHSTNTLTDTHTLPLIHTNAHKYTHTYTYKQT